MKIPFRAAPLLFAILVAACAQATSSGKRDASAPNSGERALVLVDLQYDFCPGGALPVAGGDQIIDTINRLQKVFDLVVATQDWHPRNHGSFASNHGRSPGDVVQLAGMDQTLWPNHCVQGSRGAKLLDELEKSAIARVFQKGTDPEIDSYSGFFDNGHRNATGLGDYLKEMNVTEVFVVGLATDYCVKFTALDAQALGFRTTLIVDAARGVDLAEGDVDRAVEEMRTAGVRVAHSREFLPDVQ